MEENRKVKTLSLMLVLTLICLFFVLIYGVIYSFNHKDEKCDKNESTSAVTYETIKGVYVNNGAVLPEEGKKDEYGADASDYKRLTINEGGTAKFEDYMYHGSGYNAQGKLLFGKDKLYLINDLCNEMVDTGGAGCEWPNCTHIYEFDYKDGKITYGDLELIKK